MTTPEGYSKVAVDICGNCIHSKNRVTDDRAFCTGHDTIAIVDHDGVCVKHVRWDGRCTPNDYRSSMPVGKQTGK